MELLLINNANVNDLMDELMEGTQFIYMLNVSLNVRYGELGGKQAITKLLKVWGLEVSIFNVKVLVANATVGLLTVTMESV